MILKAILNLFNRFNRLDRLALKKDFGLGSLCGLEAAGRVLRRSDSRHYQRPSEINAEVKRNILTLKKFGLEGPGEARHYQEPPGFVAKSKGTV